MNRTKSVLLAATALVAFTAGMFAAPQAAQAQVEASGVTILSGPATPTANGEIGPDSVILPRAISADGATVLAAPIPAGNVGTPIDNNIWIWVNGTPQLIAITRPAMPGVEVALGFTPTDLSGDGRTITGALLSRAQLQDGPTLRTYNLSRAVYWNQATGLTLFPQVSATEFVGRLGTAESAYVNTDGSFFAVSTTPMPYLSDGSRNPALRLVKSYRYSISGGYEYLGSLGSTVSMSVSGISGAGNVIIGNTVDLSASNQDVNGDAINLGAFRWDAGSGLTQLPDLSAAPQNGALGRSARAIGISRDGSTIVGNSRGSDGRTQAVYWRASGIQALGFLSGFDTATATTTATAASGNGSIIGGQGTGGAWLWGATTGMQSVQTLLQNAGISLNGYTFSDLNDISDTGEFITGSAFNESGGLDEFGIPRVTRGYVLSIAAAPPPTSGTVSFLPADVGGTFTTAEDISSDGSFVAGSSDFDINLFGNAYRDDGYFLWRNSALLTQTDERDNRLTAAVPLSATNASQAVRYRGYGYARTRVSGDGQTVIMRNASPRPDEDPSLGVLPNFRQGHVIWTAQRGPFVIAPPTGVTFVSGQDVNYDGSVLLFADGYVQRPAQANGQVIIDKSYRWTAEGGFQDIGQAVTDLTPDPAALRKIGVVGEAISGDGNTIAGNWYDTRIGLPTLTALPSSEGGFRWTASSGLQKLPHLSASPLGVTITNDPSSSGPYSSVSGISRDGATIVGQSRGSNGLVQATYWREGTATGLGFLTGFTPTETARYSNFATNALAASADGSVIVGQMENSDDGSAWRWSSSTGMQDLNVLATNAGINLNGFTLADAASVSDNGQFITGTAFKRASDGNGLIGQLGYVLSIAAAPITPTTLTTSARLVISLTLPGVTQTSIVNQTFSTQVDAKLNGTTVFTRTVGDQITGSLGVTALADARTSLQQTSGLRRVVIGAPVLISNTTTVQSSSSNTVNVASGTQVTTAAVVTNGPATVATGDLGTCATAATDGVNPTGCSLPGAAVAVNANVINTNTFTNTINSVTPTTTTTVNQLITAKWQVSATAGNQFGTVHALSGVAAFDRGDRLIGQLLGMGGGGQGESANRVARTAMPMRDANGLGGGAGGDGGALTMFGGYFGNWSHIDADPTVPVADVKGSTNGFVLGLEKGFGAARVGVAVDHGTSNYTVRDATYPETLGFKHTQVALFAGWQGGGFSLNGAAAYGFGTARTSLVTPTTPATASRDVKGWSLGAQAGYAVPLGRTASVELVGGVRHVSANLKAFTESGGPSPLLGRDQTVHRTRAYAGIEAQAGIAMGGVTLTPRLHARYAHDSGDASGTADLVFASAPNGPVMQALGPGVGRDVAELGGSLDAAVGGNVHVWAGYDGTFRKGAQAHAAKAGVTLVW